MDLFSTLSNPFGKGRNRALTHGLKVQFVKEKQSYTMASKLISGIQALSDTVKRLRDLAKLQADDLKGWKAAYEHVQAQLIEKDDEIARLKGLKAPSKDDGTYREAKRQRRK